MRSGRLVRPLRNMSSPKSFAAPLCSKRFPSASPPPNSRIVPHSIARLSLQSRFARVAPLPSGSGSKNSTSPPKSPTTLIDNRLSASTIQPTSGKTLLRNPGMIHNVIARRNTTPICFSPRVIGPSSRSARAKFALAFSTRTPRRG